MFDLLFYAVCCCSFCCLRLSALPAGVRSLSATSHTVAVCKGRVKGHVLEGGDHKMLRHVWSTNPNNYATMESVVNKLKILIISAAKARDAELSYARQDTQDHGITI